MNDEFLHRIRKDPPPEFAARLKARLKLRARVRRFSIARMFVIGFVVGSSALAATYWAVKGPPDSDADVLVTREASSSTRTPRVSPFSSRATTHRSSVSSEQAHKKAEPVSMAAKSSSSETSERMSTEEIVTSSQTQVIGGAILSSSSEQESSSAKTGSRRAPIRIVAPVIADALTRKVAERSTLKVDIENLGADVAFDRFCGGADAQRPDLVLATRRITDTELHSCARSGRRNIDETELGYFAVVLTAAKMTTLLKVTEKDVFLALAKQIPSMDDPTRLIDNPNVTWRQANPYLEPVTIAVFGPAPSSALGKAVSVLILEAGCESYPWIKALKVSDPERYRRICHTIREDGVYVTAEENNVFVGQRLWAEPNAMALLSYKFFDQHRGMLIESLLVEDAEPTLENIGSGAYRPSRPLLIYTNNHVRYPYGHRTNVRPEVLRFYWDYVSAVGPNSPFGPLDREALIPLERSQDPPRPRALEIPSEGRQ